MTQLEFGTYYHIFNRGINGARIFYHEEDYQHFLNLYLKYVPLIADTFSWALMENHFHFLVRIKDENEIGFLAPFNPAMEKGKWKIIESDEIHKTDIYQRKLKKPIPYRQFSHLFNAYSKWFNNKYNRTGSLFEKNFERKEVENEDYLRHLVYYIHHNPIHHGASTEFDGYQWTSYLDFVNDRLSFVDKGTVLDWFDDMDNFVFFHGEERELSMIEEFVID